eukprot:TRINITY_DN61299_c0_g1_i1.p1 TRINITY_DN61299_c0_g1~~TRINITY_DN61299_c0_g1_i1.p1  ORF type:complete len:793 (+),score=180.63 TRINITY_DN61299_c0_g1_i1:143-2521(+)
MSVPQRSSSSMPDIPPVPAAAEPLNYHAAARQGRQAEYGERWGEGAARYFSIEADFLDEDAGVRLMPVPDSFFCPIAATIMSDPVATVDGCAYERDYIERWFRERRQNHQPITSPTTGLPLPSTTLMPLLALQRAIEAYLAHRPELRRDHMAGRSFEEAAQVLQVDLLEKQAMNASVGDEVRRLREANKAIMRQLKKAEGDNSKLVEQLMQAHEEISSLKAAQEKQPVSSSPATDARSDAGLVAPRASSQEQADSATSQLRREPEVERDHRSRGSQQQRQTSSMLQPRQLLAAGAALAALAGCAAGGFHWQGWAPASTTAGPAAVPATSPRPAVLEAEAISSVGAHPSSGSSSKRPSEPRRGKSRNERSAPTRSVQPEISADKHSFPLIIQQVQQLRRSGEQEQITAVMNLLATARGGPEMRSAILQAGAVLPLVEVLADTSSSPSLQEVAAALLGILAAEGDAAQSTLLRAGAVVPLVRLLKRDVPAPTRAAASALRNLAANNNRGQLAMAQAGAIAPLINLLSHSDPGIQAQAAAALGNMAGDSSENHYDKQVTIARAGAVAPLLRLLDGGTAEVREGGAGALRMLATNNVENQVAIAQSGAITPLVQLLQDESPTVREEASAALGNLVFYNDETNVGNQVAIAKAGAIPLLVRLLRDTAGGVQEAAAGALRNLAAQNVANQESICQMRNALANLVRLLKQDNRPTGQVEAAGCIHNLAAGNANSQQLIVKAGALEPLVALLKGKVSRLREVAAAALWALARDNPELQEAIDRSGGSFQDSLSQGRYPRS